MKKNLRKNCMENLKTLSSMSWVLFLVYKMVFALIDTNMHTCAHYMYSL